VTGEPAPGICGGEKSLAAYLAYLGVESLKEFEERQLRLFPVRSHDEEHVNDRLLTARELGEYLGLSSATVLDKWERGELPGFKFGRAVRFDLDEVLAVGRRPRGALTNTRVVDTLPRYRKFNPPYLERR
jgi:excisionase family DNA binding protein